MTFNSKNIRLNLAKLGPVILLLLLSPSFALAASKDDQFCNKIGDTVVQLENRVNATVAKIGNQKTEQLKVLKNRRGGRDLLISKQRDESDRQMVLRIEKLVKQAKTPAQKQAVSKFKDGILDTMMIKRAAIDQATLSYRKALDETFNTNYAVIDAAVQNFQTETSKALDQAKVECGQKSTSKIARQRLMTRAQTAQRRFTQALKFNNQPVTQAADALGEAIQQITQKFNQSLKKVQTELSKAFSQ